MTGATTATATTAAAARWGCYRRGTCTTVTDGVVGGALSLSPSQPILFSNWCYRRSSSFFSKRTLFSSSKQESFVARRLRLWEEEAQRQREEYDKLRRSKKDTEDSIEITLPDGSIKRGIAHKTTPRDVAEEISKGLAKAAIVAVVDGKQPWDLFRPLTSHCSLRLLTKHDEKVELLPLVSGVQQGSVSSMEVFWHSSAHVLGRAIESLYGEDALLCDGPALVGGDGDLSSSGFFYDFYLKGDKKHVSLQDLERLETLARDTLNNNNSNRSDVVFSRLVVDRDFATHMFEYNPFKLRILEKIPSGEQVTLYRCGSFVDLCRGPHLPATNKIRAFKLLKTSSTYWNGDSKQGESLQRIYGISFPEEAQLKRWLALREEASKRDHRTIGKAQKLFMFHDYAPGNPFFLPHGARVVNKLIDLIRREYKDRGYEEVITPQLFSSKLWQTSGHWDHYKDDMFFFEDTHAHSCAAHANEGHHHDQLNSAAAADSGTTPNDPGSYIGLVLKHKSLSEPHLLTLCFFFFFFKFTKQTNKKPMNCPAHCLIYKQTSRSYRELPVRFADFGALHRNEMVGTLRGLTRVRRFHQDDAHIFCREDQIGEEIRSCLEFVSRVYSIFGFKFELRLSTRPETQFIGSIDVWNKAESALKEALNATFGGSWSVNEGDGAFYGPKIDIALTDALDRKHQCATIQLDFQLPQRFGLEYLGTDNKPHTPVIIHRAIFGSIERMLAIIIEHTAGNWPLWLSPRQCVVLPVSNKNGKVTEFAQMVVKQLVDRGIYADANTNDDRTLDKRILEAQQLKYNYTVVVGEKECNANTVMVRSRDTYHQDKKLLELSLDQFLQTLTSQIQAFK